MFNGGTQIALPYYQGKGNENKTIKKQTKYIDSVNNGEKIETRAPEKRKNSVKSSIEVPSRVRCGTCVTLARWIGRDSRGHVKSIFIIVSHQYFSIEIKCENIVFFGKILCFRLYF